MKSKNYLAALHARLTKRRGMGRAQVAVATRRPDLYSSIVERLGEAGVRAEDILIFVVENGFEEWYAGRL